MANRRPAFQTSDSHFRKQSLQPRPAPAAPGPVRTALTELVVGSWLRRVPLQRRACYQKQSARDGARRSYSVKISFLIPSKTRLGLLKHVIASILSQNDNSIEIVVSDNASTEDYKAYLDSLADDRIIYHRQETPVTVTENWRQALSLCTGDYVLMLGDDDALAPNFCSTVRPHLSRERGPDLVYLAAYHYGYPNVLPFRPSGYLAAVRNSEFLLEKQQPFCLAPRYARELANSVLDFRYRFGFNAQHFLLKAAFVRECEKHGGLYQSPYPDTYAAIATFVGAKTITVVPQETVIIGISPQSFGAYYFSGRHSEGYEFLDNERTDESTRDALHDVILPGDRNNTNWLIAAGVLGKADNSAGRVPVKYPPLPHPASDFSAARPLSGTYRQRCNAAGAEGKTAQPSERCFSFSKVPSHPSRITQH